MKRKMMDTLLKWKADPGKKGMVVSGARQIGKTYIIDEFGKNEYDSFLTLNFSTNPDSKEIFKGDLTADRIFEELGYRYPEFSPVRGRSLLFLDEIQMCDDARSAIKPLVDDGRCDIIASGSLLGVTGLKRSENEGIYWKRSWIKGTRGEYVREKDDFQDDVDPSEEVDARLKEVKRRVSPMGYETVVRMYPMDFEEYLWALGFSEEQTSEIRRHISDKVPFTEATLKSLFRYYRQYTIIGGMPAVVKQSLQSSEGVLKAQKDIRTGYNDDILKYVPDDIKPGVVGCLESIPRNLKHSNMKLRFVDIEGKENTGWREYADPLTWLDASGMVTVCNSLTEPVRPLALNTGRAFRLYMADQGVLMSMLDDADRLSVLEGSGYANIGSLTEHMVANMLEKCGVELYYFERNKTENGETDRIEVDFVTSLGTDLVAIEVKSGSNRRSSSLRKLMADERYRMYHFDRFIKLEQGNIHTDDDGVEHYPLFAAAFADSMGGKLRMEFHGYEDLEL